MTRPLLPPSLPAYAELHCLSNYTFLTGASHPEELVARAAQLGYHALAITDECSMAGAVRAHAEAERQNLALITGASFTLHPEDGQSPLRLVLLAQTRDGYGNLCALITLGRQRAAKGSYLLHPADLLQPGHTDATVVPGRTPVTAPLSTTSPAPSALVGVPGCLALLSPPEDIAPDTLLRQAQWVRNAFPGRAWMALTLLHRAHDARHKSAVTQAARMANLPLVATGRVEMHLRSRKPLHDTLTAIRLRSPIADCAAARAPNAEQHLRTRLRLANLYPPEALQNTVHIANLCTFRLKELRYEYPIEICPDGMTPSTYLRQETLAGATRRFPAGTPPNVCAQLDQELALIIELGYEAYFLTVYDIVRFARGRGILCQGRGSAANSAVCYCLGITEVDPARGTSLFGRFISRERNEPPDIDVDFEHQRREEVIQYIYDKYGRERAALTAVVISYRSRSALRDVGKALGVDPMLVDAVARAYSHWDGRQNLLARMTASGLDPDSATTQQWAALSERLLGFPRHLSQHPGGFVISRGPLNRLVPIERAAMDGRSIVQWDKDDLDTVGLLKVDILALGMLSVLRRALACVSQRLDRPFAMQDIPADDSATYDMICRADTIGTFQIESRAQMSMLPRLRPRTYYDLVIEVAIVRPGPMQGGMVHPYLRRRQGLEPVTYPSPDVRKALERTMGIPIFQEQVMQIAMLAAGFTAGEADALRRSMAAWRRKGGLGKYYDKIIDGMLANGYERDFAEQIFRQIQGFGEYGFPESHSASFALLAYASSWLKCHEPEAFLAAMLNSQPMGFYSPAVLVQDARRHGVQVRPVSIADSHWDALLEPVVGARPAVRLGMSLIKGMRQDTAVRILAARAAAPFTSTDDLSQRAALDQHDLQCLARADALACLAGNRRQAAWTVATAVTQRGLLQQATIHEPVTPSLPALPEGKALAADYRSLGLTLGRHPVALLRQRLSSMRFASSAQLLQQPDRRLVRAAGIVTVRQRPGTAKGVVFITLEDEFGQINLVIRPDLATRQRRELLTARLLGAYGTWQVQDGVQHLVAGRLIDLSVWLGGLDTHSRDFH